jgi:hypothetical protein
MSFNQIGLRDLREAALRAYDAIFEGRESVEINGDVYLIERTPRAGLRFVKAGEYSFLEQNQGRPPTGPRWRGRGTGSFGP